MKKVAIKGMEEGATVAGVRPAIAEGGHGIVLDVDDDLQVVEQHPAALAGPFAAYRLGVEVDAELLLDRVHDRADLAVVGGGRDKGPPPSRYRLRDSRWRSPAFSG